MCRPVPPHPNPHPSQAAPVGRNTTWRKCPFPLLFLMTTTDFFQVGEVNPTHAGVPPEEGTHFLEVKSGQISRAENVGICDDRSGFASNSRELSIIEHWGSQLHRLEGFDPKRNNLWDTFLFTSEIGIFSCLSGLSWKMTVCNSQCVQGPFFWETNQPRNRNQISSLCGGAGTTSGYFIEPKLNCFVTAPPHSCCPTSKQHNPPTISNNWQSHIDRSVCGWYPWKKGSGSLSPEVSRFWCN